MLEATSVSIRKGVAAALLFVPGLVMADGQVIDKIYHPYVDALEHEVEFRGIRQDSQPGLARPEQVYQLSFGRSFGQRLFGEIYAIGARERSGSLALEAWEAELKWQLTEQGQYASDWGLLLEYENERGLDAEEVTLGLLGEREFGRWSGTLNLLLINEWGDDIKDEVESALSLQARYRLSRFFEPALEFYAGQDTKGMGPAAMGSVNLGIRKSLRWEAGLIFGLDGKSPDQTFRFLLEYEF